MNQDNETIVATLPALGRVRINFYGASAKVISLYSENNEFDRQKQIRHLGLIPSVFEGSSHTRYEYVMLQCALCDIFDVIHKGDKTVLQGSIKVDGETYQGNSILKSWFLLSNFGHLKNTIGDEKTLLLFSLKRKGLVNTLLKGVTDDKLKDWCWNVINEFKYTSFHHIVAIWRISEIPDRNKKDKENLLLLYKMLLIECGDIDIKIDKVKLEQLKRLFRTIRTLSILTIDGHYSHTPISINLTSSILALGNSDNLFHGTYLHESFEPFLSLLHEEVYLNKDVLTKQREYEIIATSNLSSYGYDYRRVLKDAISKGIADNSLSAYKHFSRFSITRLMRSQRGFYDEFRYLKQKVRKGSVGIDVSLDSNPITGVRYFDVLIDSNLISPKMISKATHNMCDLMDELVQYLFKNSSEKYYNVLFEAGEVAEKKGIKSETVNTIISESTKIISSYAWGDFKNDIIPAFKEILWSLLLHVIKPCYKFDIDSHNFGYEKFGIRYPEHDFGLLKNNFESALESEKSNKDRAHEIRQTMSSACRKRKAYVLTCIPRITISDTREPPSKSLVTDIDGLVVFVEESRLIIEMHEAKNMKKGAEAAAKKDINNNLLKVINRDCISKYSVKTVKGYGAKLVLTLE